MIIFKRVFFTVLSLCILSFQWTVFGYSPAIDFIGDVNNLELPASHEPALHKYTQVLLLSNQNGYCVISLTEQDRQRLNIQEIQEQNTLSNWVFSLNQDAEKNLEPCQPGIAQLAFDSIDNNQVAALGLILGGIIYVGICGLADYVTTEIRHKRGNIYETDDMPERTTRVFFGLICAPMYIIGPMIRMIDEEFKLEVFSQQ